MHFILRYKNIYNINNKKYIGLGLFIYLVDQKRNYMGPVYVYECGTPTAKKKKH